MVWCSQTTRGQKLTAICCWTNIPVVPSALKRWFINVISTSSYNNSTSLLVTHLRKSGDWGKARWKGVLSEKIFPSGLSSSNSPSFSGIFTIKTLEFPIFLACVMILCPFVFYVKLQNYQCVFNVKALPFLLEWWITELWVILHRRLFS